MLIHGVVVDERDAALEWASVLFAESPVPLPDIAAITDEHGGFTVSAPVPGRYRLRCHAADLEPAEAIVDVVDQDVSIVCRLAAAQPSS